MKPEIWNIIKFLGKKINYVCLTHIHIYILYSAYVSDVDQLLPRRFAHLSMCTPAASSDNNHILRMHLIMQISIYNYIYVANNRSIIIYMWQTQTIILYYYVIKVANNTYHMVSFSWCHHLCHKYQQSTKRRQKLI